MGDVVAKGYPQQVGPTVESGHVFAPGWEQDPRVDDGHAHEWESVLVKTPVSGRLEECVRCTVCLCPRCGHLYDPDPCLLRRHHRADHEYAGGGKEPVGG